MLDLNIFSPIDEVFHPLFVQKQVRLFIKRDDMIHPFISGNKWRKLKYHLINARDQNKTHLITFGGVWSNHLLATACAAAKFGFKSTAFVRGEDVDNDTLFTCRLFGMELKFVDRESYRNKAELYREHYGNDPLSYFIGEGGAGTEAIQGCAELVGELDLVYDHIFCAAGTGATAAGILEGIQHQGLPTQLHVIPVLKGAHFLLQDIPQRAGKQTSFLFHDAYHFGGYAKTQPELLQFIQQFSSTTGILLDPVYTGKMMYAIWDLIKNDSFTAGAQILAVHTGGLFGLLGMKNKFNFT